jgi:hypothetical protein
MHGTIWERKSSTLGDTTHDEMTAVHNTLGCHSGSGMFYIRLHAIAK